MAGVMSRIFIWSEAACEQRRQWDDLYFEGSEQNVWWRKRVQSTPWSQSRLHIDNPPKKLPLLVSTDSRHKWILWHSVIGCISKSLELKCYFSGGWIEAKLPVDVGWPQSGFSMNQCSRSRWQQMRGSLVASVFNCLPSGLTGITDTKLSCCLTKTVPGLEVGRGPVREKTPRWVCSENTSASEPCIQTPTMVRPLLHNVLLPDYTALWEFILHVNSVLMIDSHDGMISVQSVVLITFGAWGFCDVKKELACWFLNKYLLWKEIWTPEGYRFVCLDSVPSFRRCAWVPGQDGGGAGSAHEKDRGATQWCRQ